MLLWAGDLKWKNKSVYNVSKSKAGYYERRYFQRGFYLQKTNGTIIVGDSNMIRLESFFYFNILKSVQ